MATVTLALLLAVGCGSLADVATSPPRKAPAPPQDWRWPTSYTTEANGVQVARLGMLMKATSTDDKSPTELASAPSLDYILAFVAVSADPARGLLSPELAGLRVVDSLGNVYPATYSELVAVDGLSVGAVRFRGGPTGVKTYSLEIARVQVISGAPSVVDGPWRLDLIKQANEQLRQGTFTAGSNRDAREMPIALAAGKVDWELGGGGPEGENLSIIVEQPSGSVTSIGVRVEHTDGAIHVIGQLDQATPTPRRPSSPP